MAVGIVDRQKLVNIADAVRAKKGITGNMTLDAIASNITSMPTADNNAKFDFSKSGSKSVGDLLSYLTTVDLSGLDTSNYTDMGSMFSNFTSVKSLDVSNLDIGKATSLYNMFNGCSSLTSLDLSNFDPSNATNMANMFNGCSSIETLDLSNFNFSNISSGQYIGLIGIFNGCKSLKTIKLPATVTFKDSGICLNSMFYNCSSLTSLDLSGFDTSNVKYMDSMFSNCSKLSNLTLGTDWASNSSIKSFDLSYSPLTHESAIDVINKLATRSNSPVIKFSNAVGLYQSEIDVATNKGWSVSGCLVLVEDPTTATVGQGAIIDGVVSKCVYVADTPQAWGQRVFIAVSSFTDSNGNSTFQWGGYGTVTEVTATDIGKGLANTKKLLTMNLQSTDGTPTIWDALKEFRSTYGDSWFVPSKNEFNIKPNINAWSSSEHSNKISYFRSVTGANGGNLFDNKNKKYGLNPATYV